MSDYFTSSAPGPENDTVIGEVINGLRDLGKKKDAVAKDDLRGLEKKNNAVTADVVSDLRVPEKKNNALATDGSGESDGSETSEIGEEIQDGTPEIGDEIQYESSSSSDDNFSSNERASQSNQPAKPLPLVVPAPVFVPLPEKGETLSKPLQGKSASEFVPWDEETPTEAPPARIQVSSAFRFSPASRLAAASSVPPTFAAQKSAQPLHDYQANIWSSGAFLKTLASNANSLDATLVRTLHTESSESAALVFRASLSALRDTASVSSKRAAHRLELLSQDDLSDISVQSREDKLLSSHLKLALEGNKRVPHFDCEPASQEMLARIANVSGSIVASIEPAKRKWVSQQMSATNVFCDQAAGYEAKSVETPVFLSRAERLAEMAKEKLREAEESL